MSGSTPPRLRFGRWSRTGQLPCPGVELPPEWLRRVERLTLRVASVLERREGAGRRGPMGAGDEFVGYRPYRAGEDLRQLDWGLLARLGKPFVRVCRRETSELWSILLDASRSMGCGPPGKLQAAAELAGGLVATGLHQGAQVELVASSAAGPRCIRIRRRGDLPGLVNFLRGLQADDTAGMAALLRSSRPGPTAGRVFLLGDFFDLVPDDVGVLRAPGRELALLQVLTPEELAPAPGSHVDWRDPEGPGRRRVKLDEPVLANYERALEQALEVWDRLGRHATITHLVHEAGHDFEDSLTRLLIP